MKKIVIDGYFFFDKDKIPDVPVIVEVGAYSLHEIQPLSARYPYSRIVVVEASPTCCQNLKPHLHLFQNLSVYNVALASADEDVRINEYKEGWDANSIYDRKAEGLVPVNSPVVPGRTLKSILDMCVITDLDLLLLNCEGGEVFALEQLLADAALRSRVNQISLSFHCDHVKIYSASVRDNLLSQIAEYYDITKGTDEVGYYLMVKKG